MRYRIAVCNKKSASYYTNLKCKATSYDASFLQLLTNIA